MAEVLVTLEAADLGPRRRQDLSSAVRTVCRLLGRDPADVPCDPETLRRRLDEIAPAAHGLSQGRWANIRCLLGAAVATVRPIMKGRDTAPLSPEWQALRERTAVQSHLYNLSRLMHWLTARNISPDQVSLAVLEEFAADLKATSLRKDPEEAWQSTAWTWNRCVNDVEGWPDMEVVLVPRREIYSLPWSAFPPSLREDVQRYLDRLAGLDLADDGPARPVKPSTLVTREHELRRFASALVQRGWDPQSLKSLADLITPEAFTEGLRFFIERANGKPGSFVHGMATLLKSIAKHMYGVDGAALAKMARVVKKLEVKRIGMTAKNRGRLRPFDDPANVDALLAVPDRLRAEADTGKLPKRNAAVRAQLAVAISILQMAPIRIGNLAAIDFDKHLIRVGAQVHLVIPAEDVKNDQELEFILPEPTLALIDWYRREHRPALMEGPSSALFPGQDGKPKSRMLLGEQIKEHVFRLTGLTVNAHLFRHLGGKLYLDQCPGQYEVVRRVLGHKSLATTTNIYTGAEGKAAVEHYDDVILALRSRKAMAANEDRHGVLRRPKRRAR